MGRGGHSNLQMIRPKTDKAEYEFFVLNNGMHVLLISDEDADKAAAAMDVRVGSMCDPVQLPGLAHFLEHMLFYSNEKYPEEDAYMKYMAEHGGGTNAYTSAEDTNYHFVVNYDSLEPALDRFAQFFICPLISKDGVAREANAVDSEHGKNVNSDGWRFSQLWRTVSDSSHPYSYFHTGNLDTLITQPKQEGIDAHLALKDLFDSRYSANLMRLAVYGKQPLSELRKMVEEKFGAVKNSELDAPKFSGSALREEHQGILLKVVPQREANIIMFQWAIPPEQHLIRSLPSNILGHLLGHEGEGSCFALLKRRGWAISLGAGKGGGSFSSQAFFSISIHLTKDGQSHITEIGEILFHYIKLLQLGITEERFLEYQALQRLRFDYKDKAQPDSYTSALAQKMQEVSNVEELLLSLSAVPLVFDQEAIHAVLKELTPQQARIMYVSKDFQGSTDKVEKWYGTEYSLEKLPEKWLEAWSKESPIEGLHLPQLNPFIPSNLNLLQVEEGANAAAPAVVLETELIQLWHKTTTEFKGPKAVVYLAFHTPVAYSSPENAVLCRIFAKLVDDNLNELSYDAHLAGLDFAIHPTTYGYLISFSGYNHRMIELVKTVLETVFSLKVDEQRFQVQKEAVSQECSNRRYEQPYQTAVSLSAVIHEAKRWHWDQYEEVVGDLTVQDLEDLTRRLWKRVWVRGFSSGNWSTEESRAMGSFVETLLQEKVQAKPLFSAQRPEARVIQLEAGKPSQCRISTPNPENENSALLISYQLGEDVPEEYMRGQLWVKCMKQEAFHKLRTQQQLGYIVTLTSWSNQTIASVAFILQSSTHPAHVLEERCEQFLALAAEKFESMTDEEFKQHVEELVKAKQEKNKRLKQQAAKEWREIDDGTLKFDRKHEEIAALQSFDRSSIAAFAKENIMDITRRKLAVLVQSRKAPTAEKSTTPEVPGDSTGKSIDRENKTGESQPAQISADVEKVSHGAPSNVKDLHVEDITDIWHFKRRQRLFPSTK